MMVEYDKVLPGYDLASNKGYGTKAHIAALKELGPTPIHRASFIKNFVSQETCAKEIVVCYDTGKQVCG